MLSLLHIENIAVIERADISFDQGFNVLTGETGAGKSIVIDAISAILGQRAYRDMIRTGTTKAVVRAVFTEVPELSWFAEQGVEYDPETVIQREIHLDGKNVCRVNGTLVTVSILHKLGLQLINIHGQHDSAALFDEENHLNFLDAFADNQELFQSYQETFQVVSQLRREIVISPVCALVRKTIPQDSARTTVVRIAVARLELTPSIPIFARMVVSAANREEAIARNSHILDPSFAMWLYCIIIVPILL